MRFSLSNDALKIKKNELAERQRVMNEKNIQRAERKTNEKESKKICSMFTTIYFAIEQENVTKVEKLKKDSTLLQEPAVPVSPVLGKDKM